MHHITRSVSTHSLRKMFCAALAAIFVSGIFVNSTSTAYASCAPSFTSSDIDSIDWPAYIDTADTDKDGDTDVLVQTWNGKTYLYTNTGGGSFSKKEIPAKTVSTGTIRPGSSKYAVFFIDFDNDGDQDIAAKNIYANNTVLDQYVWWYENVGGNNFSVQEESRSGNVHGELFGYKINTDFNNDGSKDALYQSDQRTINWYENNSSSHTIVSHSDGTIRAVINSDLNKDGNMDVLYSHKEGDNQSNEYLYWQKGNGSGGFSKKTLLNTTFFSPGHLASIQTGDIDGDGDIDIIAAGGGTEGNNKGGKILYLANDGSENFTSTTIAESLGVGGSVTISDFDKNGTLDIIQIDSLDDKVRLFKQTCATSTSTEAKTTQSSAATTNKSSTSSSSTWSTSQLNSLFRSVFGVNPTVSEWKYWFSRKADKPQKAAFVGAMLYHKQLGKTVGNTVTTTTAAPSQTTYQSIDLGSTIEASEINAAFRSVHGRNPSVSEWTYWASRRGDKPQSVAFLGAMQWQKANNANH